MRSIEALLSEHEVIWFSLGNDEGVRSRFMDELVGLEIRWVSGQKVSADDTCSIFMGIGPTRKVGHISWQIWRASMQNETANPDTPERFYSNRQVPVRINYERYISGDDDYLVTENIVKDTAGFLYPTSGQVIHID